MPHRYITCGVTPDLEIEMAEIYKLSAEKRERAGKGVARALRREGKVPAVLYGNKEDPVGLSLTIGQLNRLYATGRAQSTLLDIDIDGTSNRAIARDIQLDPVRDTIIHADFLRLGKGDKVTVEVAVNFINDDIAPGIKRGGVLNIVRYSIELDCPADNIPDEIIVDLENADIGDSVHISAVPLPEGATPAIQDRDFTIATIAAPAGMSDESDEEEATDGAEEAAADKSDD